MYSRERSLEAGMEGFEKRVDGKEAGLYGASREDSVDLVMVGVGLLENPSWMCWESQHATTPWRESEFCLLVECICLIFKF